MSKQDLNLFVFFPASIKHIKTQSGILFPNSDVAVPDIYCLLSCHTVL